MNIIQKLFNKDNTKKVANSTGYAVGSIVYVGTEIVPVTIDAVNAFSEGWNKAKAEAKEAKLPITPKKK